MPLIGKPQEFKYVETLTSCRPAVQPREAKAVECCATPFISVNISGSFRQFQTHKWLEKTRKF
jgi:hypothetical protein